MDFTPSPDSANPPDCPFALFADWLAMAEKTEPIIANAMVLATVDADGQPNARMMLLKGADVNGFVFYTNFESQKGLELAAHPAAALCFHWKSLQKQVRARGRVSPIDKAQADAYFATRERGSQLSAWASQQSRPLADRKALAKSMAALEAKYKGQPIPRPPYWSGYRLVPHSIEFWQGGDDRLHERLAYRRGQGDDMWEIGFLYP
ncbi:MAG: pyridoxamine 5'-phosphate oxidase [Alphaproteobacteria bacterium]|nr:pyridoxamine 5'-phosphate oxidase [Alphaproteobacteria bacterium]